MNVRFAVTTILTVFVLSASSCAAGPADRVEVIQTPDSVAVGLRDFDLMRRAYPTLIMRVTLLDGRGTAIDTFTVDAAHEATPSHVVLAKAAGRACASVKVRLADGDRLLGERTLALPPAVTAAGRAKAAAGKADLMPGTAFDKAAAPAIPLLDLAAVPAAEIGDAPRTVDIADCRKRVVADFNFPSVSTLALVARQTDHPDDAALRSIYIPTNSDLYNRDTGAYESTMKYLIEIPIAPAWLAAAGDATAQVPVEGIRIHMTTEEGTMRMQRRERITGNGKGLLGQTASSWLVGGDGNIYFARQYGGPVRFNVAKKKWEAPPVDVYEFLEQSKPALASFPYQKGVASDTRVDPANTIFYYAGRIWLCAQRYMMVGHTSTGGNSLFTAMIVSMPVDHWDDKDAFTGELRCNAASTPDAQFPLWSTYVQPNDDQRKLQWLMPAANRICVLSYHFNYFWIMDLNPDGSTKALTPLTTHDGKRIVHFDYAGKWLTQGKDILGYATSFTLEGETKPRRVFLPMDSTAPTEVFPKKYGELLSYYATGVMDSVQDRECNYGRFTAAKHIVANRLGIKSVRGNLTIFYDALGRMQQSPGPHKDVIARMNAASMGPEYYLVPTPGQSMDILGTSDYPIYNFARYDCREGAAQVHKTFLIADLGDIDARLNVPALIGLYCHQWFRDGNADVLYYAGYTGVARLRYRADGRVLDRFKPHEIFHGQGKHKPMDGAPDAYIKWFRDMIPGLGDKVFVTGVNVAQRGGTAYSGGLMYFHRDKPDALYKYSGMSRCYKTTRLDARLRGVPGGKLEQDIFLSGNYSAPDANTIPEKDRPADTASRVFVYRAGGADDVQARFGFTVTANGPDQPEIVDAAVAPNGLYLVLTLRDGTLATLDLDGWRYADAVRLPATSWLMRLPTDGMMVVLSPTPPDNASKANPAPERERTYVSVAVGADGALMLKPELKLTFPEGESFGRSTFLYDSEHDDGSYDLVFGPNFRKPEASIKIVRDFLPPRPQAADIAPGRR